MTPEEALRLSRKIAGMVGRGRDEHTVDDLASAALLRWCNLEPFDAARGPDERGYVLQRMRWAALREMQRIDGRRHRIRCVPLSAWCDPAAPDDAENEAIVRLEQRALVGVSERIVQRLGARDAAVVACLRDDPDQTYREVAGVLGVSPALITLRMKRVRVVAQDVLFT